MKEDIIAMSRLFYVKRGYTNGYYLYRGNPDEPKPILITHLTDKELNDLSHLLSVVEVCHE